MQSRSEVQRMAEAYEGIAVLGAVPGSPASRAGSRYGDVILEINGRRVRNLEDYFEASGEAQGAMQLLVMRNGKQLRLAVELGERLQPQRALQYAVESRALAPDLASDGNLGEA